MRFRGPFLLAVVDWGSIGEALQSEYLAQARKGGDTRGEDGDSCFMWLI